MKKLVFNKIVLQTPKYVHLALREKYIRITLHLLMYVYDNTPLTANPYAKSRHNDKRLLQASRQYYFEITPLPVVRTSPPTAIPSAVGPAQRLIAMISSSQILAQCYIGNI